MMSHTLSLGGGGGGMQPFDWSDRPFDDGPDFINNIQTVVSNKEIREANEEFTPDTFDNR